MMALTDHRSGFDFKASRRATRRSTMECELELFLAFRGKGLTVEVPAVRP